MLRSARLPERESYIDSLLLQEDDDIAFLSLFFSPPKESEMLRALKPYLVVETYSILDHIKDYYNNDCSGAVEEVHIDS